MAQGHLGSPTVAIHTVTIPQPHNSSPSGNESPSRTTKDMLRSRMGRSKTPPQLQMPVTPPRLCQSTEDDSICPRPSRERVNSRDYTHSYDGAYGAGNDDMIGLVVARSAGGWWEEHQLYMFAAYFVVLWLVALVVTMAVSPADGALANKSLTVTNFIHFAITLINLHWMKGGCGEDQGDLEHMTLWEQIEATPHTGWLRFGLRVVPILICWSACTQAGWESKECSFNALVLYLTLLGKFPFMNGVRLLGINAHPVIDKEK
jgi:hypothetical protein